MTDPTPDPLDAHDPDALSTTDPELYRRVVTRLNRPGRLIPAEDVLVEADPLAEALLDLGPEFWPEDEDHRWCDANEGGHHFEVAAWRADLRAAIAVALAARGVYLVTEDSLTKALTPHFGPSFFPGLFDVTIIAKSPDEAAAARKADGIPQPALIVRIESEARELGAAAERRRIAEEVRKAHAEVCACPGDGFDPDCHYPGIVVLTVIERQP